MTAAAIFGHLAYEVDDIYATCQTLMDAGVIQSTARPATATWPSFARRTHFDRKSCRRATTWPRRTLGFDDQHAGVW